MQYSWTLIYIATLASMASANVHDLRVDVISMQKRFAATQGVNVVLKYTNDGSETMGICRWFVPNNGLTDPMFEVTRNGEPVAYVGPLFKRRAPIAEDLLYLAPGATVTATMDLSTVFNMTQTGNYEIQYKMNAKDVVATSGVMRKGNMIEEQNNEDFVIESAPLMVFAVGRSNAIIEEGIKSTQNRALTATYVSCSSTYTNDARNAINAAEVYANDAVRYFNAQTTGTSRYTTWFGTYNSANWLKVKSHFSVIQSVLSRQALTIDCSCPAAAGSPGTYAYVYANQHYKVFLCSQFWRAPMTGTDSKGATIIHELAHFAVVGGTQDYAYGHSSAKSLASTNSARATMNSDNLQYFSENNPTLY